MKKKFGGVEKKKKKRQVAKVPDQPFCSLPFSFEKSGKSLRLPLGLEIIGFSGVARSKTNRSSPLKINIFILALQR